MDELMWAPAQYAGYSLGAPHTLFVSTGFAYLEFEVCRVAAGAFLLNVMTRLVE